MFAFHETTRKRICRAGFFVLCLAPTIATAAWIGSRHAPGRKEHIARELGRHLNAQVQLHDWRTPLPNAVRSTGMNISDAAAGRPLLEVAGFDARGINSARVMSAQRIIIDVERLPQIVQHISAWLARVERQPLELRIAQATIKLGGAAPHDQFTLHEVIGRVDRDAAGGLQMQLSAKVAADGKLASSSILKLTLKPSRDGSNATPIVELQAKSAAIPARSLAAFVPGCGHVGANAAFQGTVRWTADWSGPLVVAEGKLQSVDFASLLPAGSPHKLAGVGAIEIDQWKWRGAKIERLAGKLHLEDGRASQSLLLACLTSLYCQFVRDGVALTGLDAVGALNDAAGDWRPAETDDAESVVMAPVDLLAMRFELDREGLLFFGDCAMPDSPPGCLAVCQSRPLLLQPAYESGAFPKPSGTKFRFHLAHLVQALAAPTLIGLPASREAIEMAEPLPLPLSTPATP